MIWVDDEKPSKRPNVSDITVILLVGFGLIFGIAALLIFEARP